MSSLIVTVLSENDVRVCHCQGRLDIASAGEFDGRVDELLKGGITRLVFDLSGVDYVSSAGLRSLLLAVKKAAVARARIAVCGVSPAIMEILEIAGFVPLMNVHPDRSAAVASTAG